MTIIIPVKCENLVGREEEGNMNKPVSSIRYLAMDPVIDLRTAQPSGMLTREVDRR